jgi:putative transposase
MFVFSALYQLLRSLLVPRLVLVTENLALRQQLLVLQRSTKRPRFRYRDRLFWVGLSHLWRDWRSILVIVKPETVIKWHRQGFKWYWRWKSRSGRVGRPKIDKEIRDLIRRISRENPIWGAPRIQQNFICLAMRLRNQRWQSIGSEFVSHSHKHGRAFCGIMLDRLPQLISSPCLL